MTESIDMAIAAARERGWIGYEESLAAEVAALRARVNELAFWIKEEGERTDTCTWRILGTICDDCRCERREAR